MSVPGSTMRTVADAPENLVEVGCRPLHPDAEPCCPPMLLKQDMSSSDRLMNIVDTIHRIFMRIPDARFADPHP